MTGYNLQQAMFALVQEVRELTEAQKWTNEAIQTVTRTLEAMLDRRDNAKN